LQEPGRVGVGVSGERLETSLDDGGFFDARDDAKFAAAPAGVDLDGARAVRGERPMFFSKDENCP
jgi:hypothetical protein